jgi:hypothetical protein
MPRDFTGKRFGKLVAIRPTEQRISGSVVWELLCDCGQTKQTTASILARGACNSCGCLVTKNLTGQRFGKLIIIRSTDKRTQGSVIWLAQCDCGDFTLVSNKSLSCGTQSCGCLQRDKVSKLFTTHSKSRSAEYYAWQNMIQRCYNEKHPDYKNYGGRGITVCERWLTSFENFYADMGPRPTPEHSIDRYPDNDGNYEKSNCRWATRSEQRRNMFRGINDVITD